MSTQLIFPFQNLTNEMFYLHCPQHKMNYRIQSTYQYVRKFEQNNFSLEVTLVDVFIDQSRSGHIQCHVSYDTTLRMKSVVDHCDDHLGILNLIRKITRGHAIFWSARERNPNWIQRITSSSEMYNKCMKRVDDVLGEFNGR